MKIPLVKTEDKSITNKESEKMEGKIPRFVPRGEQNEEKKSESEEVIQKSEAQNPRVGHNYAIPTVSASQAPDPKPNPRITNGTKGGQQELINLTQGIWIP